MSLAIDPERIDALLLADGWHQVQRGTVHFDAFEYVYLDDSYCAQPKAETTGLTWVEIIAVPGGEPLKFRLFAPLNTIFAVRYGDDER